MSYFVHAPSCERLKLQHTLLAFLTIAAQVKFIQIGSVATVTELDVQHKESTCFALL